MREPDDDYQLALRGHRLDRDLTVLGRVADVVAGRVLQLREALPEPLHGLHRLVDGQRGLRQPDHLVLVAHGHVVDGVGAVHQLDVVRRLTGGTDDLFVALVADQQDVVVVAGEALGLVVHLGDQRAGGVDDLQAAVGGRLCTVGATPWAENTTIAPSGTSSVSSTNTAPALASVSTT